tara:strand:+ start:501 stop:677 length:177 start_codon:yes stop_codon:yes gene_type:complete
MDQDHQRMDGLLVAVAVAVPAVIPVVVVVTLILKDLLLVVVMVDQTITHLQDYREEMV